MRTRLVPLLALLAVVAGSGTALGRPAFQDTPREYGDGGPVRYREGELLVRFRSPGDVAGIEAVHQRQGARKKKEFRSLGIHLVWIAAGRTVADAARSYEAEPNVLYAEPNYIVQAAAYPDDPRFGEMWGLNNSGQNGGTVGADIRAVEAWDVTTGSQGVVAAVIDTGVDADHPDLKANLWTNPGEIPGNGIDDDGNGYIDDVHGIDAANNDGDPADDHGHGTHVAGTIGAAGNNARGVAGVNWATKIMACKFLRGDGYGDTSDAIECLQYVRAMKDRGVPLVATNNSWGGGSYSQGLADAIRAQKDILFVAAAGNNGSENDGLAFYPASYPLSLVVAVAATDRSDARASFSCYGRRTVDLGAPGKEILSTLPDANVWGIAGGYGILSGTSMATPHVTGVAALLKAKDSSLTASGIRNLLFAGGDPNAALAGVTLTGRRLNARQSLSCTDRPVFAALETEIPAGVPATLRALSIDCAMPVGPVSVSPQSGGTVVLLDDGVAPDEEAGDGIFSGTWIPPAGPEPLTFSSPLGTDTYQPPALPPAPPEGGLYIDNASLPAGYVNHRYYATLQSHNGVGECQWTVIAGALPPGLSLDRYGAPDGTTLISGTPRTPGSYIFSAQAQDGSGQTATQQFGINVFVPFEITTSFLPEASPGVPYSAPIRFTGGVSPCYWSVATGALPPGLSIDASTGVISGAATAPGTYEFTVKLVDSNANEALKALLIHAIDMTSPVELWSAVYNGGREDQGYAVAADPSGNALVAGTTAVASDDYLVVKYDGGTGAQLWERKYAGPYGSDWPHGIASDEAGSYYVTGMTLTAPLTFNVMTVKYDAAGNELWRRSYPDPMSTTSDYRGRNIAVDAAGNVYVTAETNHTKDCLLLKYDGQGNLLWSRIYDGGGIETPHGLGVDAAGYVYVAMDNYTDVLLVKYDTKGRKLWERRYDSGGTDTVTGAAVTSAGAAYVTGYNAGGYLTIKYDAAGNLEWARTFRGSYNALSVAADEWGDAYVAGRGWNGLDWDYMVVKYSSLGDEVWAKRSNASSGQFEIAYGIAVAHDGRVFVTGTIGNPSALDVRTVVYGQPRPLTIEAVSGPGGSITPSGTVVVPPGGSQAFAIAPLAGYRVADVLVDGVSVGPMTSYTFSNVTDSHTISASFAANAAVRVLGPNGGEAIASGSTCTIRWESQRDPVGFRIYYNVNGGRWKFIGRSTELSIDWKVPTPSTNTTGYRIRVDQTDARGKTISSDQSDDVFGVEVVRLTTPNGGESWKAGSTYAIAWVTNGTSKAINRVTLSCQVTAAGAWNPIASLTGDPGAYDWTIPAGVDGAQCRVKVELFNKSASQGADASDDIFVISP